MSLKLNNLLASCCGLVLVASCVAQTNTKDSKADGETFVASTPCTSVVSAMFNMSADTRCEFMKWSITFFNNGIADSGNYTLTCTYGMTQPNTTGFARGAKTFNKEGKWKLKKGRKSKKDAVIYQLDPEEPQISLSFLKLNDDLLHLLYKDGSMMIGTAGWSYTFNRTKY
jgi:hypothetical protein